MTYGYERKWIEDKQRFVTKSGAKLMLFHVPPNWDQLWPKDRDMGTDFTVEHPSTQPLSDQQRLLLNDNSHRYYIINFWKNLSSGTFGTVWSVECMKKNDPNATQTEILAQDHQTRDERGKSIDSGYSTHTIGRSISMSRIGMVRAKQTSFPT